MKFGIIGYGKMGRAIEKILLESNETVVYRINRSNSATFTPELLGSADVAIEFSTPETAFSHVTACLHAGVPVVSGTTGWIGQLEEAFALCRSLDGAFLYASNFSIGVNLFFLLNRYLATLMSRQTDYEVKIEEIHHLQKRDYPSGTAITLANDILHRSPLKEQWKAFLADDVQGGSFPSGSPDVLNIESLRVADVPGTHIVSWFSAVDTVEIRHTAHSRESFARGAVQAARWLVGKKGVFTMEDVLGFEPKL